MNEKQVTALVWYIAVVWAVLLLAAGAALPNGFLKPISTVVGAVVLLLGLFERWLWPWRAFRGWLVKRPDVRGTWSVELHSNWSDPVSGKSVGTISGYLVVRQTFSRLSMRVLTAESSSRLRGAEIVGDADDSYELTGVYVNEPSFSLRPRSPIHYGAFVLAVRGTPPTKLEGHYWTDRGSSGEMHTTGRMKGVYDTFSAAHSNYQARASAARTSHGPDEPRADPERAQ